MRFRLRLCVFMVPPIGSAAPRSSCPIPLSREAFSHQNGADRATVDRDGPQFSAKSVYIPAVGANRKLSGVEKC